MRVTERMIQDSGRRHLQAQIEGLAGVQEQITSGKRLARPAEDPVAAGEILDLRSNLEGLDAYDQTTESSRGWLAASDTSLQALSDLVIKARTIALRGSSSTAESMLPQLADEAEEVLKEAVATANSRHGGDYILAGFKTDTLPFDLTSLTVTYQGDSGAIMREVEPGHQLQINVSGDTIEPALSELADLVDSLRSGDVSAVAGHLSLLDDALDQITSQVSKVGLAADRTETARGRLDNVRLEVRGLLSRLEDTDMAEAAVELNSREQGYRATLAAIVRGNRQTLMDYLR
ncbi:MAG: flagellar hook-associated protein FlgL [Anaerolineae bacterium]